MEKLTLEVTEEEFQMILDGLDDTISLCGDWGFAYDKQAALYKKLEEIFECA